MSDGRPIIGLSSMQLAELVWSIDEGCLIIPAHIWTPWFSMFGSKSGFDSIEECWGEFADRIYAVETGLSSSPEMNWRIKELDNRSIVSFGDAHSPAKLGREVTVFRKKSTMGITSTTSITGREVFNFKDLAGALKKDKDCDWEIGYTIEFHPEEGKYHYTGHRNCGIRQSPRETKKKGAVCPVCGKPLTLGVMHRVEELAGREIKIRKVKNKHGLTGYYNADNKTRPPYVMLVPLMEVLSESMGVGVGSKRVQNEYENLTKNLGSEIEILTQTKLEKIESLAGAKVAKAVKKARKGDIVIEPGFDGVFGTVKIWVSRQTGKGKVIELNKKEQISLF